MILIYLKSIIIFSMMFDSFSGLLPDSTVNYNGIASSFVTREKFSRKRSKDLQAKRDSIQSLIDISDLIHLNVRGQRISTRRRTLSKVANSTLAAYFNSSSNEALQPDYDGSYFLDYNPLLFTHLLDQLRDLRPNEPPVFRPPPPPASAKSFNEMLNAFKLPVASRQGSDLVVFNVGGEIITTLREIFFRQNISLPTRRDEYGRVFLDEDPEIFRSFLAEVQQGKSIDELHDNHLYRQILKNFGIIKVVNTVQPVLQTTVTLLSSISSSVEDQKLKTTQRKRTKPNNPKKTTKTMSIKSEWSTTTTPHVTQKPQQFSSQKINHANKNSIGKKMTTFTKKFNQITSTLLTHSTEGLTSSQFPAITEPENHTTNYHDNVESLQNSHDSHDFHQQPSLTDQNDPLKEFYTEPNSRAQNATQLLGKANSTSEETPVSSYMGMATIIGDRELVNDNLTTEENTVVHGTITSMIDDVINMESQETSISLLLTTTSAATNTQMNTIFDADQITVVYDEILSSSSTPIEIIEEESNAGETTEQSMMNSTTSLVLEETFITDPKPVHMTTDDETISENNEYTEEIQQASTSAVSTNNIIDADVKAFTTVPAENNEDPVTNNSQEISVTTSEVTTLSHLSDDLNGNVQAFSDAADETTLMNEHETPDESPNNSTVEDTTLTNVMIKNSTASIDEEMFTYDPEETTIVNDSLTPTSNAVTDKSDHRSEKQGPSTSNPEGTTSDDNEEKSFSILEKTSDRIRLHEDEQISSSDLEPITSINSAMTVEQDDQTSTIQSIEETATVIDQEKANENESITADSSPTNTVINNDDKVHSFTLEETTTFSSDLVVEENEKDHSLDRKVNEEASDTDLESTTMTIDESTNIKDYETSSSTSTITEPPIDIIYDHFTTIDNGLIILEDQVTNTIAIDEPNGTKESREMPTTTLEISAQSSENGTVNKDEETSTSDPSVTLVIEQTEAITEDDLVSNSTLETTTVMNELTSINEVNDVYEVSTVGNENINEQDDQNGKTVTRDVTGTSMPHMEDDIISKDNAASMNLKE